MVDWEKTWSRPYGRYNRHHEDIWKAISPVLQGKVADLGCGPCMIYKGKDIDLTGVDSSENALKEARKNYPEGVYVLADTRNTGLPSGTFDSVVMFGLLDYFEDWHEVMNEARRILKPDGVITATLLNGFNGHYWGNRPHLTGNWHYYQEYHGAKAFSIT